MLEEGHPWARTLKLATTMAVVSVLSLLDPQLRSARADDELRSAPALREQQDSRIWLRLDQRRDGTRSPASSPPERDQQRSKIQRERARQEELLRRQRTEQGVLNQRQRAAPTLEGRQQRALQPHRFRSERSQQSLQFKLERRRSNTSKPKSPSFPRR